MQITKDIAFRYFIKSYLHKYIKTVIWYTILKLA